jgi:integrase
LSAELRFRALRRYHAGNDRTFCTEATEGFTLCRQQGDQKSPRPISFRKEKKWIASDPTEGIIFFPVEKRVRYVPQAGDIEKVIAVAKPDMQDYLWTMRDSLARMSEINRLTWRDVDLEKKVLVLYTRKKRGGHLTPRKVPMANRVFRVLSRRHAERDPAKPRVFWHTYHSSKTGEKREGPFRNRKRIMKTLCRNAGVAYFRYHAVRHAGASAMDSNNVPIGAIQRILGHENRTTTEIYLHSIGNAERVKMTADVYGHLVPGANRQAVTRLPSLATTPPQERRMVQKL